VSYSVDVNARRAGPLALAAAGTVALAAGLAVGDEAAGAGAVAFALACAAALRDSTAPVLTWRTGIVALILVIWLIPIKNYRLPVDLPFDLEVYRLLIMALTLCWLAAAAARGGQLRAGGHGRPALLLAAVTLGALLVNINTIREAGLQTEALKSVSFSLSFLLAFVLVCSTLETLRDVDAAVSALVIGGTIVAIAAIYESRTFNNYFNELGDWIPFLDYQGRGNEVQRGGRLRVRASAQHPIALGAVLAMCVPLAFYLAQHGATRARRWLWTVAAFVTLTGALSTLSRTVVIMLVAMTAVALWVRRRAVVRLWPLLVAIPLLVPVVAPGTLRTLYAALTPEGGLVAEQRERAGGKGSGRIADLRPGLDLWIDHPVLGPGPGTGLTRDDVTRGSPTAARRARDDELARPAAVARVIFDNQYMLSLVTVGAVGLAAVVWFVWGAALKLARSARRLPGKPGDLLAACGVACAGFAIGMFTYDTFAFVQVTLVFYVIAALGLTVRGLSRA
jgi:hypothetical protein